MAKGRLRPFNDTTSDSVDNVVNTPVTNEIASARPNLKSFNRLDPEALKEAVDAVEAAYRISMNAAVNAKLEFALDKLKKLTTQE